MFKPSTAMAHWALGASLALLLALPAAADEATIR